jgi:thiol-disulfide isomerase/thioredoxin
MKPHPRSQRFLLTVVTCFSFLTITGCELVDSQVLEKTRAYFPAAEIIKPNAGLLHIETHVGNLSEKFIAEVFVKMRQENGRALALAMAASRYRALVLGFDGYNVVWVPSVSYNALITTPAQYAAWYSGTFHNPMSADYANAQRLGNMPSPQAFNGGMEALNLRQYSARTVPLAPAPYDANAAAAQTVAQRAAASGGTYGVPAAEKAAAMEEALNGSQFSTTPQPPSSPEFPIHLTPSGYVSPSQFRGKVVVLACILTTCPHCQTLVQMLSGLQREYGPQGLQVLAVAFNPMANTLVPDFIKQFHPNFPVGWAEHQDVLNYLNHSATTPLYSPSLVFIDRNGIIRYQRLGDDPLMIRNQEKNVRDAIEELLTN